MYSIRFTSRALAAAVVAATVACADSPLPTSPTSASLDRGAQLASLSEGRGAFQRYVAMGTSLSMGVASDGAIAASQEQSWPAQLARMADREMTLPLIALPGCRSPFQTPLASGVRLSGEAAGAAAATLSCAPNLDGVRLPTQNVAINGARVSDALFTTPENITDPGNAGITARVLAPGQTQISALESQNPKIVSIEFGANELLPVLSGIAIPGATIVPYATWAPLYTQLIDRAAAVTKYGVLVGLVGDVANIPALRRGSELYADRVTFSAAFNVTVATDCDGSDNLIFVPVRVPTAVATGLAMKKAGAGAYVLSCAAGGPTVKDYVLTPSEAAVLSAQAVQMTAYIKAEAERLGFAYFELNELFRSDFKPVFSVVQVMTSAEPYGAYSSLDGVHPSAVGQRVVAEAAARALDARYNFGISAQLIAAR